MVKGGRADGQPPFFSLSAFSGNQAWPAISKRCWLSVLLTAELPHHLATEGDAENPCNGKSHKTVLALGREFELEIPRDRTSSCEPKLVAKHQRRMPCSDDLVIGMSAA